MVNGTATVQQTMNVVGDGTAQAHDETYNLFLSKSATLEVSKFLILGFKYFNIYSCTYFLLFAAWCGHCKLWNGQHSLPFEGSNYQGIYSSKSINCGQLRIQLDKAYRGWYNELEFYLGR